MVNCAVSWCLVVVIFLILMLYFSGWINTNEMGPAEYLGNYIFNTTDQLMTMKDANSVWIYLPDGSRHSVKISDFKHIAGDKVEFILTSMTKFKIILDTKTQTITAINLNPRSSDIFKGHKISDTAAQVWIASHKGSFTNKARLCACGPNCSCNA